MECTPNRESLLALIQPDMHLTKEFLKRIYSFELDYPGFADQAIAALEAVGCDQAREHYTSWVQEYESKRDAELKEVAHWYRLECEKRWKKKQEEGEEKRKQKETEHLQQMSNKGLIVLLENLTGAN
jgi:hypothetical protein